MGGKRKEIRKGPWKAEEDQVLLNHVSKYGPRDWSSIRARGLLQRTGKSCRLRWVNKLRPNLKSGCKFSPEEERIVIEFQAQFGNKWARIATYLPGRTDNDVKNFWSSRQKRLTRILENSAAVSSSSNSKSHRSNARRGGGGSQDIFPYLEVLSMFSDREEVGSLSKPLCCPSPALAATHERTEMMPLPADLAKPEPYPLSLKFLDEPPTQLEPYLSHSHATFPLIPESQAGNPFSLHNQELLATLDDPFFYDILEPMDTTELENDGQLNLPMTFFDPRTRCQSAMKDEQDTSLDDFPADLFDQVDTFRDSLD